MKQGNRHYTRKLLLQAIYQWRLTNNSIEDIVDDFKDKFKSIDEEYFRKILNEAIVNHQKVQDEYLKYSKINAKAIDTITHVVLTLATCEFYLAEDLDYRIIINEALELSKEYGSDDSYKFVNGILERISEQYRKK